jgi:hypothetical protein
MGITLTGKRVQNTYDSLLKLSDNQNLTGTAKIITDGYGNDSPLYLSTSQFGIGITPSYQFHTSGNAKIGGNLIISGNLTVNGTLTYLNVTDLQVEDPLIKLAKDNTSNTLDIGFFGKYVESATTKYTGLFWDASTDKFRLYEGLQVEPTTTVDVTGTGYTRSLLNADLEGNVTGTVSSLSNHDTNDLVEGSVNLYFTTARARASFSAGDGITITNGVIASEGDAEVAKRIEITVKNVSGSALVKGAAVHASPTATPPSGNVIEVIGADNDVTASMPAIGILNEAIADEAEGQCVMVGSVTGINTSSFTAGQELYVGSTAGVLTNTKPTSTSNQIQKIAVVIKSHASNGQIEVFGAGRANDVPNLVNRTITFDPSINVTSSTGLASIEVGGASGGFIDLKAPASDDYDLRFITSQGGNEITTASGDLKINTGNTLALTLDGSTQSATFTGTLTSGDISTTGITVDSRLVIQNSLIYDNAANGNNKGFGIGGAGLVPLNGSGVDTNNLVDIGTSDYKFKNLHLSGFIQADGNITTDGIFINNSAPDDEVVQFIQNGRKTSLKTYFSTGATGSHLDFRISDGSATGGFDTPLVLYPDQVNINGKGVITTLMTNNIEKATTGSPILINSGSDPSLALRVYYDMQLFNSLSFTDVSWNNKGRISANSSGILGIQGGSGTDTIFINSTDQVKIRNNADLGTYTRLGIAMDIGGNAANLDESTDYNAMSIAPYRVGSSYGMYFGGGHGSSSSAGFIQGAKIDGTDSSTISLNPFGGAIGINTGVSDPSSTLHIKGSFRTHSTGTYPMGILNEFVSTTVSRTKFGNLATSSNLEIYYDISGNEEARITRNYANAALKFMKGSDTHMEIDKDGNVYIPTQGKFLKFGGYSYIGESIEDLHSLTIASDFTESIRFSHYNRTTSAYELNMIIKDNSRVGIGTDNPSTLLSLNSLLNGSLGGISLIGNGAGDKLNIWVQDIHSKLLHTENSTDAVNGYGRIDFETNAAVNSTHPTRGGFSFKTAGAGQFVTFTNTGRVGIGITDPSAAKLVVNSSSNPQILVKKQTAGGGAEILFEHNDGGTQYASIKYDQSGDNQLYITTGYDSPNDLNRIYLQPGGETALTLFGGNNSTGTAGTVTLNVNAWLKGYAVANSSQQNLIRSRAMGYPGYYGLQIGQETNHIALFIDPGSVAGGAFSGNVNEIMLPNKVIFQQANSGGTDWLNGQSITLDNAKLGLGINTPLTKFHIQDGAGGGNPTDSRTKLYINSSGEAYIGINVPTNSFGGIRLAAGGSNKAFFELYDNTTQGQKLSLGTVDARDVVINTTNTERLRIKSNGNVNLLNTSSTDSRHFGITNAAGTTGWTFGNGVIANSHQFVIYDNTAGDDRFLINSSGGVGINCDAGSYRFKINSTQSETEAIRVEKPYSSARNIGSVVHGNNFVRNSYDTFTIAQSDVSCLVITETVAASNQGAEQRLTLTAGDGKCVIGTSSTITNGMYFNVARSTSSPGYVATNGITALRLRNDGEAIFANNIQVQDSIYVADYIYHLGDTNTYLRFTEDTFTFRTGGNDRAILNNNALNVGPGTATSSTVNDGPLRVCNNSTGNNDMGRGSVAVQLGPKSTRTATVGNFYGGITWNGLLNYGNNTSYDIAPHVWVGAKMKDFPGSERSSFVVGVKSGSGVTGGGNNIPVERLEIDYTGKMTVSGNVLATGSITANGDVIAFSDKRLKENIKPIKNALKKVTELKGVSYNRIDIDDKSNKIGFIAQDVKKVLPEVVSDNEKYLGVNYGNITAVLVEAIKEQQKQIVSLQKEINNLKNK